MNAKMGSLCTGYGGLDIAAEALLGARTAWCAEFEDAPSRVIEARYPGVPNVLDVKRIPWWIMAPIDVMTAGYPCQPFSLAGARKGEDDPRHLWPSIAEGIKVTRPRHVLLENVRGHLSLGFDKVLHDLNALGYGVAWRILSAAAVGACHRRERLFIYAQPAEHVAAPGSVVLAVAGAYGWTAAEADLFGERAPYREALPVSGVMVEGRIYATAMPQPVVESPLFPTPDASVANDGEGLDTWLARRERVKATGINGNGMGMPLAIAVQTLPTPTAHDSLSGPDYARSKRVGSGGDDLATAVALLPTPAAGDAAFGMPRTSGRPPEKSTHLATRLAFTDFGAFGPAVARHERMLGRPAPAPTRPNTKGNPEHTPEFVEWMMCLEPGRVTDPALWGHLTPRKAREVQLKMLGNGVVPPQALAAFQSLTAVVCKRVEVIAA
ncbi:DNA cytosine methyltransferase [Leucobacter luti]|uniref:DNA cytosine methyltransferase n=1 Tax=Leucobacter luti TaxID=340320 RepID=UPI003CFE8641